MANISENLESIINELDKRVSSPVDHDYGLDIASRIEHIQKQMGLIENNGSGSSGGGCVVLPVKLVQDYNEPPNNYLLPWNVTESRVMLKSEFDQYASQCITDNKILCLKDIDSEDEEETIAIDIICTSEFSNCRYLTTAYGSNNATVIRYMGVCYYADANEDSEPVLSFNTMSAQYGEKSLSDLNLNSN